MTTKEANHLKDKFDYLNLNSSKANLVRSVVPSMKSRSKGRGKKS